MTDLLVSAITVSVRLVLPALFICGDKEVSFLERSGRIVTYGLLLNIVPAVVLGAFGLWTPVSDVMVWLAICGLSAALGFARGSRLCVVTGALKSAIPVLFAVVAAVLMPIRSEWLAGGWDPGLYQTSAVEISRSNGTAPFNRSVYSDMTIEERAMFSRNENGHHEIMAGVPITLDDGLLHHYFFPLTPVFGAWLHRIGGIPLLIRSGTITAFLGILPFVWLLLRFFDSRWKAAIGLFFLLISPMWWYHQAVPTSELLQLLILAGGIAEYISHRDESRAGWGLCLIAFGMALNRFSDPPLLAVMLFVSALAESTAADRKAYLARWVPVCAGLLAGMLWIIVFYPLTIARLQAKDAVLLIVMLPFFLAAGGAVLVSRFALERWQNMLHRSVLCGMLVLLAFTVAAVIPAARNCLIDLPGSVPLAAEAIQRYVRLVAYNGPFYFLFSAAGLCALFADKSKTVMRFGLAGTVCAGLAAVCAVLILNPGIAPFYPWALRRYIIFAIPLLCISQAFALITALNCWSRGLKARIVSVLLILAAAGAVYNGISVSIKAMRASDYLGMAEVVSKCDLILGDGDIVVADDARWATPLLLVLGLDVIDGSIIWQRVDSEMRRCGIEKIKEHGARNGRRVVWLTSTEDGLSIYRDDGLSGAGKQIGQEIRFEFPNVIHSSRAAVFQNRVNKRSFRLFVVDE